MAAGEGYRVEPAGHGPRYLHLWAGAWGSVQIEETQLSYFDATENPTVSVDLLERSEPGRISGKDIRRSWSATPEIPAYLEDVYHWAYLNPRNVRLLDRESIVSIILWGQHHRLQRAAFAELKYGQRVLQPAAVYGDFSPNLARHVGPRGRLVVTDVAPIQVACSRRKLRDFPWASARRGDARAPGGAPYDAVCCYFLLHELPEEVKGAVVDGLLASVGPGGRVVFVDYHEPLGTHPLKLVTSMVFDTLEPFAKGLWRKEIADFASHQGDFHWRQETYFGGLFQKVVAERR